MVKEKTFVRITNKEIFNAINNLKNNNDISHKKLIETIDEIKTNIAVHNNRITHLEKISSYITTGFVSSIGAITGLFMWLWGNFKK